MAGSIALKQLATSGATDGQVAKYVAANSRWEPGASAGGTFTRRVVVPAQACFSDTAVRSFISSTETDFLSFAGSGLEDDGGVSFMVPMDYVSGGKVYLQWTSAAGVGDQIRWELAMTHNVPDSTELYTTIDETLVFLDNTKLTTAWQTNQTPAATIAATLVAGNWLHFRLRRDPGHVDDVENITTYIAGVIFEYVGN